MSGPRPGPAKLSIRSQEGGANSKAHSMRPSQSLHSATDGKELKNSPFPFREITVTHTHQEGAGKSVFPVTTGPQPRDLSRS